MEPTESWKCFMFVVAAPFWLSWPCFFFPPSLPTSSASRWVSFCVPNKFCRCVLFLLSFTSDEFFFGQVEIIKSPISFFQGTDFLSSAISLAGHGAKHINGSPRGFEQDDRGCANERSAGRCRHLRLRWQGLATKEKQAALNPTSLM